MKRKYYYENEMCVALGYRSLNPVVYEADHEEATEYHKVRMDCDAISKGICHVGDNCRVFKATPEKLEGSYYLMTDKKLG